MEGLTTDLTRTDRCEMCGGLGWVLDGKVRGGTPAQLELLPCLIPDCPDSGRELATFSVNLAGFTRVHFQPQGAGIASLSRGRVPLPGVR